MTERYQTTEHPIVILARLRREAEEARESAKVATNETDRKRHLADAKEAERHIENLKTSLLR